MLCGQTDLLMQRETPLQALFFSYQRNQCIGGDGSTFPSWLNNHDRSKRLDDGLLSRPAQSRREGCPIWNHIAVGIAHFIDLKFASAVNFGIDDS
jgi:hypothetical protein